MNDDKNGGGEESTFYPTTIRRIGHPAVQANHQFFMTGTGGMQSELEARSGFVSAHPPSDGLGPTTTHIEPMLVFMHEPIVSQVYDNYKDLQSCIHSDNK